MPLTAPAELVPGDSALVVAAVVVDKVAAAVVAVPLSAPAAWDFKTRNQLFLESKASESCPGARCFLHFSGVKRPQSGK